MPHESSEPNLEERCSLTRGEIYRVRRRIKQSNVLSVSDSLCAIETAFSSILHHRAALENYIRTNPILEFALDPLILDEDAPQVARLAAEACEIAGVGPMAAIPGALAELAVNAMLSTGSRVNLVENGGEIAASSNSSLTVGIYAGQSVFSGNVGFLLSPCDFPIGIATSSATVSHALNFGEADAAVVIADTASMADAVAKAAAVAHGHMYGVALEVKIQHIGANDIVPLLEHAAGRDGEISTGEAVDALAATLGLTEDDLKQMLPSGIQQTFVNRVGWAATYMKKAGLLEAIKQKDCQIETMARRLESSTDLTRMIVHDLKGPLASILANLDLLMSSKTGRVEREILETAMSKVYPSGLELYPLL